MAADELKVAFSSRKSYLAESSPGFIHPEIVLRARPAAATGFQAGTRGRARLGALLQLHPSCGFSCRPFYGPEGKGKDFHEETLTLYTASKAS
jgi:hypothetical protein